MVLVFSRQSKANNEVLYNPSIPALLAWQNTPKALNAKGHLSNIYQPMDARFLSEQKESQFARLYIDVSLLSNEIVSRNIAWKMRNS
jgi:hypothetical protein